jgi:uncharacterized protein YkwD
VLHSVRRVLSRRPPTPPATVPSGTSAEVQAVLDLTNVERASRGLSPVSLHPKLTQAAKSHCTEQFRQGCSNLSYTGTDGSSPFDRIRSTGFSFRAAGENLAWGFQTPSAVMNGWMNGCMNGCMNGWMNSAGHRANILNGKFTSIGLVAAPAASGRMYRVQVFRAPL